MVGEKDFVGETDGNVGSGVETSSIIGEGVCEEAILVKERRKNFTGTKNEIKEADKKVISSSEHSWAKYSISSSSSKAAKESLILLSTLAHSLANVPSLYRLYI